MRIAHFSKSGVPPEIGVGDKIAALNDAVGDLGGDGLALISQWPELEALVRSAGNADTIPLLSVLPLMQHCVAHTGQPSLVAERARTGGVQ